MSCQLHIFSKNPISAIEMWLSLSKAPKIQKERNLEKAENYWRAGLRQNGRKEKFER